MTSKTLTLVVAATLLPGGLAATTVSAQEESIRPGINRRFEDPNVDAWIARFERDGRAIYDRRAEIVRALDLEPGIDVADIGAGTGFFSLMMAEAIGPRGRVYAVDLAQNFLDHIATQARERGLGNVSTALGAPRSPGLEEGSLDRVFLCDTYHHFEFPFAMLAEIRKALRPDGRLILVDFERIKGETREFVWNMVRAGKGTFTDEIIDAGFELLEEVPFTDEHYILRFKKRPLEADQRPGPAL